MEILTKKEKEEAKARARRSRCIGIISRIEELKNEGYGTYDSKLKVAQELGVTIQVIYGELRWYEQNKESD